MNYSYHRAFPQSIWENVRPVQKSPGGSSNTEADLLGCFCAPGAARPGQLPAMPEQVTIYYLSGTGNALSAARWIAENALKKGIQADLVPIDRFTRTVFPAAGGKGLIGFCYPTHGFSLPWFMLKFILKFPARARCAVFLLNTRAGSKIGRLFLPGVSGVAQLLPALILLMKGFRIRGLFPLDLPSNWTSIHPGYNPPTVMAMFARCRSQVDAFCTSILAGRSCFRPNVFVMLPVDILLAPIAFMYFLYGRFWLAKLFMASSECDGCGLCAEKCPTASIRLRGGRPFWRFSCESCMRCMNICPRRAIQVSHLLAAIIGVAGSFLPLALAYKAIDPRLPEALQVPANFIVKWGAWMAIIFLVSGLVFRLLKARPVNRLFTLTSLTKYWRRYKAPGVRPGDF